MSTTSMNLSRGKLGTTEFDAFFNFGRIVYSQY